VDAKCLTKSNDHINTTTPVRKGLSQNVFKNVLRQPSACSAGFVLFWMAMALSLCRVFVAQEATQHTMLQLQERTYCDSPFLLTGVAYYYTLKDVSIL